MSVKISKADTYVNLGLVIAMVAAIYFGTRYVVETEKQIETMNKNIISFQKDHNKHMKQIRVMINSTVKHCCSESDRQLFYDDIYSLLYKEKK